MLHNNNYFNNYMSHNMYYRPAPIYPHIEKKSIDHNDQTDTNQDDFDNNINDSLKECISESDNSNKDRLSIFGLSIHIDDIIIIGILIFLFMERKKDYLLLIILGLMLFDISIDTFKNLNIVKQLFNPT